MWEWEVKKALGTNRVITVVRYSIPSWEIFVVRSSPFFWAIQGIVLGLSRQ